MCHCYGKITVELVPIRAGVTLPMRTKPLSQREMRGVTYQALSCWDESSDVRHQVQAIRHYRATEKNSSR